MSLAMSPVRFGWSKANPPQNYQLALTREDVAASGDEPTDTFVQNVAERLVGKADEDSRFALITGAKSVFAGDKEAAERFKYNLDNRVMQYLSDRYDWFDAPNLEKRNRAGKLFDALLSAPAYLYRKAKRASTGYIEDAEPDVLNKAGFYEKIRRMNGLKSVHFTHFDYDDGLLSLMYGPFANIRGGFPKVSDIRQLVRDHGRKNVRRAVPFLTPVRAKTKQEVLDKYTIEPEVDAVNDWPMFLALNRRDDWTGIAHGVSDIEIVDPEAEAQRKVLYSHTSTREKKFNTWC